MPVGGSLRGHLHVRGLGRATAPMGATISPGRVPRTWATWSSTSARIRSATSTRSTSARPSAGAASKCRPPASSWPRNWWSAPTVLPPSPRDSRSNTRRDSAAEARAACRSSFRLWWNCCYWHRAHNQDAAHLWFRRILKDAVAALPDCDGARRRRDGPSPGLGRRRRSPAQVLARPCLGPTNGQAPPPCDRDFVRQVLWARSSAAGRGAPCHRVGRRAPSPQTIWSVPLARGIVRHAVPMDSCSITPGGSKIRGGQRRS